MTGTHKKLIRIASVDPQSLDDIIDTLQTHQLKIALKTIPKTSTLITALEAAILAPHPPSKPDTPPPS